MLTVTAVFIKNVIPFDWVNIVVRLVKLQATCVAVVVKHGTTSAAELLYVGWNN